MIMPRRHVRAMAASAERGRSDLLKPSWMKRLTQHRRPEILAVDRIDHRCRRVDAVQSSDQLGDRIWITDVGLRDDEAISRGSLSDRFSLRVELDEALQSVDRGHQTGKAQLVP